MDAKIGSALDASVGVVETQETVRNMSEMESVEEIFIKVDQLEHKLNEVEQFYSSSNTKNPNTPKSGCLVKDKERDKFLGSLFKNRQQDAASREAAAAHRMQDLMRQFGVILRQLTQHKWAGPFMQPVDVVGLGLHDYYEVIEKPMDFSTIKSKMEAKDGNGYKNVREMCSDVRLIFKNAMKYNKERDDVHVMAKTLLDKFETKWLQLLPKVDEEEERRKEEEAEMHLDVQLAQEAAYAKMARDLSLDVSEKIRMHFDKESSHPNQDEIIKLDEVDTRLEDIRDLVLQKCRKMTTEEKKRLGSAITRLSPEDIDKALDIIAQNDPAFQAGGETVEVDIDAQSEATLWKLKFFVKDTLQSQMKSSTSTGGNNGENNQNCNNKRKREVSETLAKTAQRKSKILPPS